jgi:hypothetical protein
MGIDAVFRKPFAEQTAFFRGKLGNLIPTESWLDVQKSAHDTGFMVAGAAKADLLADLARAVDGAIADGQSIGWFRAHFDEIAEKHGWGHKGEYNWRTRTIYRTNMASSYAAGRLVQLKSGNFTHWMYRHSDSVARPRPLHVSWDGLALPADDAWWQTHYPPNGWGCQCYVIGVTRKTAERLGGRVEDAPDDGLAPDGRPNGIDKGWDYMPGASVTGDVKRQLKEKLPGLPQAIARDLKNDLDAVSEWDLTTPTGQWHHRSYPDAPAWLKAGALRAGPVTIKERVGSVSYQQGNSIVMGHPSDTPIGKAVWRHEFGHFMDSKAASRSFMRSAEADFTAAMEKDGALMKNGAGLGRQSKAQAGIAQANKDAAGALAEQTKTLGSTEARAAWLRGQADDVGIDLDEFRAWFTLHSAPGDMAIGDVARDWWEAQFLQAWKRTDAQGLMDAIEQVQRGSLGQEISGKGIRAYNKGLPGMVSDLFSAATYKRVEGAGAHKMSYYKQRAGWGRQAECWANICSIAGSGSFGERLLERFSPDMFAVLKGAL